MNYLVSDFTTRIKNACLSKRQTVLLPYSKITREIGKVLVKEHFLEDVKEEKIEGKKMLVGRIKYVKREPLLTGIQVMSKPSLRVYKSAKTVQASEKRGNFTSVYSTNQGILTGKEALKKGVGGELLFKIW